MDLGVERRARGVASAFGFVPVGLGSCMPGSPQLKRYSAQIERLRARGLPTEAAEALITRWEEVGGSPPDREDPKAAEFW